MDCLMRIIIPILALVLFLYLLAVGAPDEAYGRVSKVVDGDTIDVTLQLTQSISQLSLKPGDEEIKKKGWWRFWK
jgi:endonuclease YncB( thermonuclease family)